MRVSNPVPPELTGVRLLEFRVLLSCSCGHDTDLTFDGGTIGTTGRSCTCGGCGASHWFDVKLGSEET
jgi:hypothetical protein